MDDDENLSEPLPPARVKAGALRREFSLIPLEAVNKGREVVLELEDEVEVSPGEEAGSFYLTVPGSPGVIYCEADVAAGAPAIRPGMFIRGVGAGYSGLPGFLRLTGVAEAAEEEASAEADAEAEGE